MTLSGVERAKPSTFRPTFDPLHTILEELEELEEGYDFVMAVNTKGVWLSCKYAIAEMLKQEALESGSRGKILNIASIAALIGRARHHAYSASKAAVVNLTRNLAVMYGPQRININAVCPGLIPTALTRPTQRPNNGTGMLCKTRLGHDWELPKT